MSILDGVQGGKQYFYHLFTDASAAVPAVLEKGVFAPKLAKIPQFGKSLPAEKSALLGFSPVLNQPGRLKIDPRQSRSDIFAIAHVRGGMTANDTWYRCDAPLDAIIDHVLPPFVGIIADGVLG